MQFAGPAMGILSFIQARKQAKVQEAVTRTNVATAQLNSSQRQKQRLDAYSKLSASNRARSGKSGTTFSGSSSALEQTNIGITNEANFEDIFNTEQKVSSINVAGESQAEATRLRGTTSLLTSFAGA